MPWEVLAMITDMHPLWPKTLVHKACGTPVENVWNMVLVSCAHCQALITTSAVTVEWRELPMMS
jgi:hypothetical protein